MRLLLFTLFFAATSAVYAQDLNNEEQIIQSQFGMDKRSIVNEFIKIDGIKREKFLKLYDEYEQTRKAGSSNKFALLNRYVIEYTRLSEEETDEIMKEIILLTAKQDKLIADYYKKIKKSIGTTSAAQFYQIEWYVLSEIRTTILESIPVINELEKRK